MANISSKNSIVGVIYNPGQRLQFVTKKDRLNTRELAVTWTRGPKMLAGGGRRRPTSSKGSCTICLESDIDVQICPNKCKTLTCIDCIIMYCTTNEVCSCYNCKYEYTCIDISRMCGSRRTELLDIKYSNFVELYDRYIDIAKKKIDISYEIQDEWQLSEAMGDALIFGEEPPEDTDSEWWADIQSIWKKRTTYDVLLRTNYVDICSKCTGGISPATWKCVRCSYSLCKKCGICHNTKNHKCAKEDIETRKEVIENSKCCPHCSTRIYKIEGCDIMWCTVCRVRFLWESGQIIEKNIHNPEHSNFLTKFYDGLNVRMANDFNVSPILVLGLADHKFNCMYRKKTQIEYFTVFYITKTHIPLVIELLIDTHASMQEETDISANKYENERLSLLVGEWTKDKYITEMKNNARGCFFNRYNALYLQSLIGELIDLCFDFISNSNYSNETLYEQYCLKISAYNKDFCHLYNIFYPDSNRNDILYRMIYTKFKAYYNIESGIIIPHIDVVPEGIYIRSVIRNILQSVE